MGNRASSNAVADSTPQDALSMNVQVEEEANASGVFLHKDLLGKQNFIDNKFIIILTTILNNPQRI